MTKQELEQQRTNLVLQRAAAKDQIEQLEDALKQVGFALNVLKANEPSPETPDAE